MTCGKRRAVARSYRAIFAASNEKARRFSAFGSCVACRRQSIDSTLCSKSMEGVESTAGKFSEAERKSHTATSNRPSRYHVLMSRLTRRDVNFVTAYGAGEKTRRA